MVQLGQKVKPFTTRLPYFMENVTTKTFSVGLGGLLLVVLDSIQVWWIRTRLKFGGLGLDSSLMDSDST